jgi:hypothetical protein
MITFLIIAALTATDPCDSVHAAYTKSFQVGSNMAVKNSGAVNVTDAQGTITGGSYTETCQLLREETLHGEAATVYSDVMKAPSGTANGTVWISKSGGLILQQEVNVDMGAKGKGSQTITFNYKKK